MFKKHIERKQKEPYCEDEILFRAKRIDNGAWVSSDSITHAYYNTVYLGSGVNRHEVIPATIGRFTGLKDNNGEKIFEGDILKISAGERNM